MYSETSYKCLAQNDISCKNGSFFREKKRLAQVRDRGKHSIHLPEIFTRTMCRRRRDTRYITLSITAATNEVAGKRKGISIHPLTLVVRKEGVPDLTMVGLPGITRVPVHGQPKDIYEQIYEIIMEFIMPEESIILNVLLASVDFSTRESIRMSQQVDMTGQRTLAVVTKVDKSPEGLLEKVTADDVNIGLGLGYVCVRNRIGDESYEQARAEEAHLFEKHPLLSMISKSMVGVPVLAQKLVQIQATIIVNCLPDIVRKIDDKLSMNLESLRKLPRNMTSLGEAMTTFMQILGSANGSLKETLLTDDSPDDQEVHCAAKLAEMLKQYSEKMHSKVVNIGDKVSFLLDEMSILEKTNVARLPNFLPRDAFLTLLQKRIEAISSSPFEFVDKTWSYIEKVVVSILMQHFNNYPQLLSSAKRAAQNLIAKKKQQSVDWVANIVEMEKHVDYTSSSEFMNLWYKLMSRQSVFMHTKELNLQHSTTKFDIHGYGEVDIAHLRGLGDVVQVALDLKMRLIAYWKIAVTRMVDNMSMHLLFGIQNLVKEEMQKEIIDEIMGPQGNGLQKMLESSPEKKRKRLTNSIELLKESAEIIDKIEININ